MSAICEIIVDSIVIVFLGSPLLSLSSSHLKEVVDPVGSLMTQIHKLIYISQVNKIINCNGIKESTHLVHIVSLL